MWGEGERARSKNVHIRRIRGCGRSLSISLSLSLSLSLSQVSTNVKMDGTREGEARMLGERKLFCRLFFSSTPTAQRHKKESGNLGFIEGRAPHAARQSQKGRPELGRSEGRLQESNEKCCNIVASWPPYPCSPRSPLYWKTTERE